MLDEVLCLRKRDDVFFKLPLARALLSGVESEFSHAVYLEHLFFFNSFYEEDPPKRGGGDFLSSFEDLAQSIASHGLDPSISRLELNADGQLVAGSHRMALTIASSQLGGVQPTPSFAESDFPSQDYSLAAFERAGVHPVALRKATIEKINVFREAHVPLLVVWPRAHRFREEIDELLLRYWPEPNQFLELTLNDRGLRNLVGLTYQGEEWATTLHGIDSKANEVSRSTGNHRLTIYILDPAVGGRLREMKEDLRGLWGGRFQGVHTTDTWEESMRVFTSVSSRVSRAVLNVSDSVRFLAIHNELSRELGSVSHHPLGPLGIAVSGSIWLDLFNIRRRNDLDLITSAGVDYAPLKASHNEYLSEFGFDARQVLSERDKHVWVMGSKFIAPWVYYRVMTSRREPKDLSNLEKFEDKLEELDNQQSHLEEKLHPDAGRSASSQDQPVLSPLRSSRFALDLEQGQLVLAGVHHRPRLAIFILRVKSIGWRMKAALVRLPFLVPQQTRTRVGNVLRRFRLLPPRDH